MNLRQKGISRASLEERAIAESVTVGRGKSTEAARSLDQQHISREVYTGALSALQDIMIDLHKSRKVSFEKANDMAENLARSISKNRKSFLVHTAIKDYDAFTYNHSVNVCIYAASIAETLTNRTDEVVRIAQAAFRGIPCSIHP